MTSDRAVTSLSYLEFTTHHFQEWEAFATDVLGVPTETDPVSGAMLLRMNEHYRYSVALVDGPGETISALGWDVRDAEMLDSAAERVESSGFEISEASEEECAARDATRILWFRDPDGVRTDLVYGRRWVDEPLLPTRPMDGIRGLGHVTLATPRLDAYLNLYQDVLRFRLSDYRSGKLYFLGCSRRHHSLALAGSSEPGVHHFFLDLETLDDVGRQYDVARTAGYAIEAELGRHGNDRAVSFYVKNPCGFSTECGWGGIEVDDDAWVSHEFTRGDLWGHQRTPEDAALVAQGPVNSPDLSMGAGLRAPFAQ